MGDMTPAMHLRLEEEISKLTMLAKQTAVAVEKAEEEAKKRSTSGGDGDDEGVGSATPAKDLVSHNAMQRYDALSMSVRSVTNQLRVVLEGKDFMVIISLQRYFSTFCFNSIFVSVHCYLPLTLSPPHHITILRCGGEGAGEAMAAEPASWGHR